MAQNKKVYSFKSVGQLDTEIQTQAVNTVKKTPIGIVTPVAFSQGGSSTLFEMNFNILDQIKDNLKNLVLTNSGERLMLTDLGANIRPLLFNISKDEVASEAIRRISKAVSKFMPFIELDTFETKIFDLKDGSDLSKVQITIGYNVPALGNVNQTLQINVAVK